MMFIVRLLCAGLLLCLFTAPSLQAREAAPRLVVSLNVEWDFEQTDSAYPPGKFTHKIPAPGLIDLARPRIEEYDELIMGDPDRAGLIWDR